MNRHHSVLFRCLIGFICALYLVTAGPWTIPVIASEMTYDQEGRITALRRMGETTRYQYSSSKNQEVKTIHRRSPEGETVSYKENLADKKASMTDSLGHMDIQLDEYLRPKTLKYSDMPSLNFNWYRGKDVIKSLAVGNFRVNKEFGLFSQSLHTPVGDMQYQRDSKNNRFIRKLPNGVITIWQYDSSGQLISLTHQNQAKVLGKFDYDYQADGRLKHIHECLLDHCHEQQMTYDAEHRLTQVSDGNHQRLYTYTYDALGNRLSVQQNTERPIMSEYDSLGRLHKYQGQPAQHDKSSNLSHYGDKHFHFSGEQLIQADTKQGNVKYQYDGTHRIGKRTIDGKSMVRYLTNPFSDSWQPLVSIPKNGEATYFIWEGDWPLAEVTGNSVHFFLGDYQQSHRLTLSGAGDVTETVNYSPFGVPELTQNSHHDGLFPGFSGLLWDPISETYLTKHRFYDPQLGRFLQVDPQLKVPVSEQDLSTFSYVGNDPLNFYDLNGNERVPFNSAIPNEPIELEDWANFHRQQSQQQQTRQSQQRLKQLELKTQEMLKDVLNRYASNTELRKLAESVLDDIRINPTEDVDHKRILHHHLEKRVDEVLKDYIDKPFNFIIDPSNPKYREEMIQYLGDNITEDLAEELSKTLEPYVGKLGTIKKLKLTPGSPNYRSLLKDFNTVFAKYDDLKIKQATEQYWLENSNLKLNSTPLPYLPTQTKPLINVRNSRQILNTATQTLDSALAGISAGVQWLDLTTSALQASNMPTHLKERTQTGWIGDIKTQLFDDVTLHQTGLVDTSQGKITRSRVSEYTSDFGTYTDISRDSTPASWFERFVFKASPLKDYYDPATSVVHNIRRNRQSYSVSRKAGQTAVQSVPSSNNIDDDFALARQIGIQAGQVPYSPPPPSPHRVGGIDLKGAKPEVNLGQISGVALEGGNIVLLDDQGNPKQSLETTSLSVDDVVTIFKSVYLDGGAYVSIDPISEQGKEMAVRLNPQAQGQGQGTFVGYILTTCDLIAKLYSIGKDPRTQEPFNTKISGYKNLLDPEFVASGSNHWHRFWIVPQAVLQQRSSDPAQPESLALFKVPLKLKTEEMAFQQGQLVPVKNPNADDAIAANYFAQWFSQHWDEIDQETIVEIPGSKEKIHPFRVLNNIATVSAIAESLRNRGESIPHWMLHYQVKTFPVPDRVPATTVKAVHQQGNQRIQQQVYGGVTLTPPSDQVKVEVSPNATRLFEKLKTQIKSKPMLSSDKIQHQHHHYTATILPGANQQSMGGQSLSEIDLQLPLGSHSLALTRHFNSLALPQKTLFGKVWSLDLPKLIPIRIPIQRDERQVQYQTTFQVDTPLNSWSLMYRPNDKGQYVAVSSEDFLPLASADDDRIGTSTHVVQRLNGLMFHFDPDSGRLLATQVGETMTLYKYDGSNVSAIEAWEGNQKLATIQLKYDEQNRIVLAKGKSAQGQQTVLYSYEDSHLARVTSSTKETKQYVYQGDRVSRVGVNGNPVLSVRYGDKGDVITQDSLAGTRHFKQRFEQNHWVTETLNDNGEIQHSMHYDAKMRPISQDFADGSRLSWSYDDNSELNLTATSPTGQTHQVRASTQKTILDAPNGQSWTMVKDSMGGILGVMRGENPVVAIQKSGDRTVSVETEFGTLRPDYDQEGQLKGVWRGSTQSGKPGAEWHYSKVDSTGKLIETKDSQTGHSTYTYDPLGRLSGIQLNADRMDLKRNNQGQITSVKSSFNSLEASYDEAGMLQNLKKEQDGQSATVILMDDSIKFKDFDGSERSLLFDGDLVKQLRSPSNVFDFRYRDNQLTVRVGHMNYRFQFDRLGNLTGLALESSDFGKMMVRWLFAAIALTGLIGVMIPHGFLRQTKKETLEIYNSIHRFLKLSPH